MMNKIYYINLYFLITLSRLCSSLDINGNNSSPVRQFNITCNHQAGSYIGSIVSNDNLSTMQPPFYIVPIMPEDSSLFEKYISVDLDSGKISLNQDLKTNNITLFKFSVLSINEGTALTIMINVLNQNTQTSTTEKTTITSTSTSTTTTTKFKPFEECLNLSLNGSTIGKSDNNCYSIDTKPLKNITQSKCNIPNDLKKFDLDWTGILVPTCDNDNYGISMIYIDRLTIENYDQENSQSSIFMLNDVKYPNNVDFILNNLYNKNDDFFQVKNANLEIRCSKNLNKIIKLNVNRNDEIKSDFVLLNTNHRYFIKHNPIIIDYLTNNFKNFNNQNKSNFVILTKYTSSEYVPVETNDSDCINIENGNSIDTTTVSSFTKSNTLSYSVIVLQETSTHFKKENKIAQSNHFKFNLNFFLIAIFLTISFLLAVLYLTFVIFKKRSIKSISTNSISTLQSTLQSNKYNCPSNIQLASSNFNSLRLNQNERDNDNLVKNEKVLESNMFEKFFVGFMSLPSRHINKLSGSLSTNTILTRTSTTTDTNNFNNRDLSLKSASKHSMSINTNNHNDYNLESLTGLKVNEINVNQDHDLTRNDNQVIVSDVAANSYNLFAFSDNYLNQMGINMMENIKALSANNNDVPIIAPNQTKDLFKTYSNEYTDLNYQNLACMLNWQLDFKDYKDVLDDLAQLK